MTAQCEDPRQRMLPAFSGTASADGGAGPERIWEEPQEEKGKLVNIEGPCFCKFLVPNHIAGALIGKEGTMIGEIELLSKCRMQISGAKAHFPGTQDRICIVGGHDQERLKSAMTLIIQKIRGSQNKVKKMVLKLVVPMSAASTIIGRRGEAIQEMQAVTECRMNMSPRIEGFQERLLTMTGDEGALKSCVLKMVEKIQDDVHLKEHMYLAYDKELPQGSWSGERTEPLDPNCPLIPPAELQTKTKRELIVYLKTTAPRDVLAKMCLLGSEKNAVKSKSLEVLLEAAKELWVSRYGDVEFVEQPAAPLAPGVQAETPAPLRPGLQAAELDKEESINTLGEEAPLIIPNKLPPGLPAPILPLEPPEEKAAGQPAVSVPSPPLPEKKPRLVPPGLVKEVEVEENKEPEEPEGFFQAMATALARCVLGERLSWSTGGLEVGEWPQPSARPLKSLKKSQAMSDEERLTLARLDHQNAVEPCVELRGTAAPPVAPRPEHLESWDRRAEHPVKPAEMVAAMLMPEPIRTTLR